MQSSSLEEFTGFIIGRYEFRFGECTSGMYLWLSRWCYDNYTSDCKVRDCSGLRVPPLGELCDQRCGVEARAVDEIELGVRQASFQIVGSKERKIHSDAGGCHGSSVVDVEGKSGDRVCADDNGELGVNTLRNREWRRLRKERKHRKQSAGYVSRTGTPEWRRTSESTGYFSKLPDVDKDRLMLSRAKKLEAENILQQAKAERALELLRASDVEKEKKMRETRVLRVTETNKVKVEQAFSKLAASGNVPGFAETVVSGAPTLSTGSISPNSSVSAAEVHAMQKELLELQRRDKKISEQYKKIDPVGFARILKQCEGTVDTSFTADTNGHEIAQYGGYHLGEDNRYHTGETFDYLC